MNLLELRKVHAAYERIDVLYDIDLAVDECTDPRLQRRQILWQRPLIHRHARDRGAALSQPGQQLVVRRPVFLHGDAQPGERALRREPAAQPGQHRHGPLGEVDAAPALLGESGVGDVAGEHAGTVGSEP